MSHDNLNSVHLSTEKLHLKQSGVKLLTRNFIRFIEKYWLGTHVDGIFDFNGVADGVDINVVDVNVD